MRTNFLIALSLALVLLAAVTHSDAKGTLRIAPLELPATLQSAQPSVVADEARGEFVLSWQQKHSDGCHSLQLTSSSFDTTVISPSKTAARGCDWFINWADFPSVAVADNGDWVTHYLQKIGDTPYAYRIMVTRSRDRGVRWEAAFQLHDDKSPTEHGFVALSPAGGDRVLAVWLDGRKMHSAGASDGHSHDASSHSQHSDQMSLRSAVIERGSKLSSALEVDGSVCSCCNNDLARVSDGHQLVFRDRLDGEIRDIGTAFWRPGRWHTKSIVHSDGWKITGCPVNGPAVAASPSPAGSRPKIEPGNIVVWTTMVKDQLVVRARLRGEKTNSEMVTLDAGKHVLGRVDAAPWGTNRWLVSWLGAAPSGQSALIVAALDANLRLVEKHTVAVLPAGRNIGMPRLASLRGQRAILVWTDTQRGSLANSERQSRVRAVEVIQGSIAP